MLSSKIKTLLTDGIDPLLEGKANFEVPIDSVDELAKARAITCMGCRFYKQEPIDFLRVIDKTIPGLSEKSCGKCGCILSYKLRQSQSICKKWEK